MKTLLSESQLRSSGMHEFIVPGSYRTRLFVEFVPLELNRIRRKGTLEIAHSYDNGVSWLALANTLLVGGLKDRQGVSIAQHFCVSRRSQDGKPIIPTHVRYQMTLDRAAECRLDTESL